MRSAMRLKAMAAERAPTIATTIQKICRPVGAPFAASTAREGKRQREQRMLDLDHLES